jgi:hypothetical protein
LGINLTVTYEISVPDWYMTTTQLYVGTEQPESAPGQFPYKHEGFYATTDTYIVPIIDGTDYYVAAHADVVNEGDIWPTLDEIAGMLPDSADIVAIPKKDGSFNLKLSNAGILDGTRPAWCIDRTHKVIFRRNYSANIFSSYELIPDYLTTGADPYIDHPENLDLVNWVINHDGGYTNTEVQNVIWFLIDNNPGVVLTAHEQELYDAAQAYGENFVPDFSAGDVLAVIVAPTSAVRGFQAMITEFSLSRGETAWAMASDGIAWTSGWGTYFTYTP